MASESDKYFTYPSGQKSFYVVSGATASDSSKLYSHYLKDHRNLLSNLTSEPATPIIIIHLPKTERTISSSEYGYRPVIEAQYRKIDRELTQLAEDVRQGEVNLEPGAIESAKAVVEQLKRHELAPPELSWLGGDAVLMLWALGNTSYALTITDGEVGYVARRPRETIRRRSNIKLQDFDFLRLR